MIGNVVGWILSGFSIIISIIALYSSIKTGNKQIQIGELQSTLQERQVDIKELQKGLQEKQVTISELQTTLQEKQVMISQMQADFQNKVELYLLSQPITLKDANNKIPDKVVPAIYIRNIGSNVIYLEKYLFNGREYPLGKEVLPPVSSYDGFRYIFLPTDGTIHVSFEIKFRDWKMQKWKTVGYADFKDGVWDVTYSPCEKRGSNNK